jgi:hypothetical protein
MIMLIKSSSAYLLAVLCALIVTPAHALVPRAYVASYGDDSNISSGCSNATHPCRWFFTAVNMVQSDGEVVAIDTSNYGPVTLTKSISLTAAPGIYAGIAVGTGATGITIASPNINVALRGLTINGQGGSVGILMDPGAAGSKLSIENCVISNFWINISDRQYGVSVQTTATVRMVNTLVRDNDIGILLDAGATADISGSKFLNNSGVGIFAVNATANTTTSATVSDTVVMGVVMEDNFGIFARADVALAAARVEIIRSSISNTETGVGVQTQDGIASVSIRKSMVTGSSQCGLSQVFLSTLISYGNNTLADNGPNNNNVCGTLTTATPL